MDKQGFYVWLIIYEGQPVTISAFSDSPANAKKRILACKGQAEWVKSAMKNTPYTMPVLALSFEDWQKHNKGPIFSVTKGES